MSGRLADIGVRVFGARSPAERVWMVALLTGIVATLAFLYFTGDDWRLAVADRLEKNRSVGLEHEVRTIIWHVALANVLLLLGLFVTRRWWVCNNDSLAVAATPDRGTQTRTFLWGLLVLVLLGAGIRWPRMDLSLYNDEEYTFRRFVAGQFKDGEWRQVTWEKTAFFNKAGNNGIPYSLLARLCYDATDAVDGEVREIPLRLPAYVAGVLSIAVIGLLGFQSGSALTGWLAATFTALHPWHIRYSTEARAYGLVLLFAALALLALYLALQRKEWRWWILFAVAQFAYLYAYPAAVYLAAGLNLIALVALAWKDRARIPRLLVANLLSVMLLAQTFGPAVPQFLEALGERVTLRGAIPASWWIDIGSYFGFGMPWFNQAPASAINPAFASFLVSSSSLTGLLEMEKLSLVIGVAGIGVVVVLVLLGSFKFVRDGLAGTVLVIGSLLSVPFAWLHCTLSGNILHFWYVIFALPFVLVVLARGTPMKGRFATPLAVLAFGMWLLVSQFPLRTYLLHPKEDIREVVTDMRGAVYPDFDNAESILTAGFWSEARVYDPELLPIFTVEEFEEWLVRARAADAAYITFARRGQAVGTHGEIIKRLETSGEFQRVRKISGLENDDYNHFVFRLGNPRASNSPR
ncbi:MAG: glycosyltransferase family 39 protein [Verrucomicrobiota bacterium]